MNILQKQVLATAAMFAPLIVFMWVGVQQVDASTNREAAQCEAHKELLLHIVTLREAGWSEERVSRLVRNPGAQDLVSLVYRFNEEGLAQAPFFAEVLRQRCMTFDQTDVNDQ